MKMPIFNKTKDSKGHEMQDASPEDIITALTKDPDYYEKMSKKESEVWGKMFSDPVRAERVKLDQAAAASLNLNRRKPSLSAALKKHNIQPVDGLSLACGGGRAERQYLKQKLCKTFHGIDISADALREAEKSAKEENLNITYEQGDLNKLQLKKNAYDLCLTQNCLHHVLHLEDLAQQIYDALRPDGILWVHDYVGETQFQYTDTRLEIINRILKILPEKFHKDRVNERKITELVRRKPGTLISPFEAIRSAEIMPIFLQLFDVVEKHESDSIINLVCQVGMRENYVENEDTRTIFEMLLYLDELLIQYNVLLPRAGIYMLRPKKKKT